MQNSIIQQAYKKDGSPLALVRTGQKENGMASRNPATRHKTAMSARAKTPGPATTWRPVFLFLLAVGLSAAGADYFSRTMSPNAFLPVMSGVLFASAAVLAAIGWSDRKARPDTVTCWDVAGAVTLVGCAAAMMTEPEEVMQVFGLRQNNN
jgi:hypothetical protein